MAQTLLGAIPVSRTSEDPQLASAREAVKIAEWRLDQMNTRGRSSTASERFVASIEADLERAQEMLSLQLADLVSA